MRQCNNCGQLTENIQFCSECLKEEENNRIPDQTWRAQSLISWLHRPPQMRVAIARSGRWLCDEDGYWDD